MDKKNSQAKISKLNKEIPMGKLPAFLFYPKDWLTDFALQSCSLEARAIWINMLCIMFGAPNRGVLAFADGTPWTDQKIAEAVGGDVARNMELIAELLSNGVAHRNSRGAIFCRRMVRDEEERKQSRKRMRNQRAANRSQEATNDETVKKSQANLSFESDATSATLSPRPLSEIVDEKLVEGIAKAHPHNWRERGSVNIPAIQYAAIIRAIKRDGLEIVKQGTLAYADAVSRWLPADRQFVMEPAKWYDGSHYLSDPRKWEKSNGNKAEQQIRDNLEALERFKAQLGVAKTEFHC
jgi:hypothetical protein